MSTTDADKEYTTPPPPHNNNDDTLIKKDTLRKVPFAILASTTSGSNGEGSINPKAKNPNQGVIDDVNTEVHNKKRKRTGSSSPTTTTATTATATATTTKIPKTKHQDGSMIPNNKERLKTIGKKTRQRLNEELRKRKEIVRLIDHDDSNLFQKKKSTKPSSSFSPFAKATASIITKKKKSSSMKRYRSNEEYNIGEDEITTSNIGRDDTLNEKRRMDTWCPSTRKLKSSNDIPKCEKSNIVQLHGLPRSIQTDHIRKFFTGLSPQRIFMLPSLPIHIFDLDADVNHEFEEEKRSTKLDENYVERYPIHLLRVFVKFQSYLIADVALSRSGELVRLNDTTSAAITVTPVTKIVSTHLQKYMCIDGMRGENICDTLERVERNIPKVVNELLWIMAKKELKLNFDLSTIGGTTNSNSNTNNATANDLNRQQKQQQCPTIDENELLHLIPARTLERQQKLVTLYNHLLDIYEYLECKCSSFMMQDFHPIISNIPSHRLIHTASTWILDQLDMIKKCIDAYQFHVVSTE